MQIVFSGKQREKFGGKANGIKYRVPAHGKADRVVTFTVDGAETTDAPPQAAALLLSVPGYAVVEAKPAPAPKSAKE